LVEYFSNYAARQFKKLDFEKNAFKDEKDLSKERKQLVPLFYSQILI